MTVKFYTSVDDSLLKFAVIFARYKEKWVLCKHRERESYEFPGGHRESDESISQTAKRELQEETGAVDFEIRPVFVYSVTGNNSVNKEGSEAFGMLFYAEVFEFQDELTNEIEQIFFFEELPDNWTYPLIQPVLFEEFLKCYNDKKQ